MNSVVVPLVKFCGMTRECDVQAAIQLGVDYIGVILVEGTPRGVSIVQAAKIRRLIPENIKMVTVVRNPTLVFLEELMQQANPDIVQFHGDESPEFCTIFSQKFDIPYWKAIAVKNENDIFNARFEFNHAQALVLDAWSVDGSGGHGVAFDWNLLSETNENNQLIMLAGGLNPDNLDQVKIVFKKKMIDGVDVSSGIEQEPPQQIKGIKSLERMKAFIQKIK